MESSWKTLDLISQMPRSHSSNCCGQAGSTGTQVPDLWLQELRGVYPQYAILRLMGGGAGTGTLKQPVLDLCIQKSK